MSLRKFDWTLFGACIVLVVIGLSAIYSTSLGPAGEAGDFGNFRKQSAFAAIGILAAISAAFVDYRPLFKMTKPLYIVAAISLVAVLVFGRTAKGATAWFGVGGYGIQPVELVKVFMVIILAKTFADEARDPIGLRRLFRTGLAVSGIMALVLLQPDLGSALLIVGLWGSLLLISGVRRSHLFIMLGVGAIAAVLAWSFVLKSYQQDRITAFLVPSSSPLGHGYNVTQSIIAIGSGGPFGKGLGFGSQSQLRFLPERQTDFIFAVVAEELGFFGVCMLMALFGIILYRCYRLAVEADNDLALFLVLGVGASLAVEVAVNIGGNLRLLPVTGVTLPFVSYGGSSLIAKFLMLGLLQSVAVRR